VRKANGSPAIKLGAWSVPVLSPDGTRVLAVEQSLSSAPSLSLLPVGVGEIQKLNSGAMVQMNTMGFVPDGESAYFAGDDGQGWRMYLLDLAGAAPRTVTPVMSVEASHFETQVVSPDRKFIFARDLNGKGQLYPLAGGEPHAIPGWSPDDIWIAFSADGRSAYVYHDDKSSAPVYRLDVSTGKREQILTLAPGRSDLALQRPYDRRRQGVRLYLCAKSVGFVSRRRREVADQRNSDQKRKEPISAPLLSYIC
jgi:Tol biopolymer transport system component